jgi:threonine/homoserine/homoserine lactone efflux protein
MSIETTLAFAAAFFVLAVSPGPGLAAILSRALAGGISAGLAVTAGLVLGDAVFMAAAMIGLSAIASALGPAFQVVKYAGALYLIWLGITTLRSAGKPVEIAASGSAMTVKDFMLGLVVTLGNPKPILFYGAFLPTFLDLQRASVSDFLVLMTVVVVISFFVYSGYILLAERAREAVATSRVATRFNQATGIMLIGSGIAVASR